MFKQNCEIILASTSKVRKKILEESKLNFKAIAPDFDEEEAKKSLKSLNPKELAIFLAKQKALSISSKFKNAYVIGSDQVCEFEGRDISKSHDEKDAQNQLEKFSGKIHYQNNAVIVAFNNKIIFNSFAKVKMQMRNISKKEIAAYIKSDKPFGCAGSYKYESLGKHLFVKTSGDYYAILGLSIQPLLAFFYKKNLISIKI